MRILLAEDDAVTRRLMEALLTKWGYQAVVAHDGSQAWGLLQAADAPSLAILDWMMPHTDGVEVCRRLRAAGEKLTYVIMLTAKDRGEDTVAALEAGADDYVVKPFDHAELRARVQVGVRVIGLQKSLADRVGQLELAMSRVKQLEGLIPICSYCKKIRDDRDYWHQLESYVSTHSEAQFTHSICPDCFEQYIVPELDAPPVPEEAGSRR